MSTLLLRRRAAKRSKQELPRLHVQTQVVRGAQLLPLKRGSDGDCDRQIKKLWEHEKIYDYYYWEETLQEGGDGGKVVFCSKRKPEDMEPPSTFDCVMKIRSKDSVRESQSEMEFRQLLERLLNFPLHEGMVPLLEVLENDRYYFIVMERATGGDLLNGLVAQFQDGILPEARVRQVMREILEALNHVHRNGMLHRDIKPDNLVLRKIEDSTGPHMRAALIDFDHAHPDYCPGSPKEPYFCGTLLYNAPETYLGYHSPVSDLYSVGVVLYLIMTGKMPYSDHIFDLREAEQQASCAHGYRKRVSTCETMAVIHERMRAAVVDWNCDPWPEQLACRDFCMSLLDIDPLRRPASAQEALAAAWITGGDVASRAALVRTAGGG